MINDDVLILEDKEILDALKDEFAISIWDAEGIIIYGNAKFEKVIKSLKTSKCADALLRAMASSDIIYLEICKTLMAGSKWQGMLFGKGNDDQSYCLETTIKPVKNAKGTIEKYIAMSTNVAASNHSNATVSNTFNDEHQLLEYILKDAVFITKQGKIFNTSENKQNIVWLGSNIYDYINPTNLDYLKHKIATVFKDGKTCKYQSLGLSSKMNQICYVTKIKPVFNFQGEVIYASVKSKKRKLGIKTNSKLKSIETKYTNIFQSINVGIIVVANANGIIIEWNKGAERAFGYTDVEIIGEHLSILVAQGHLDYGIQQLLEVKDKLDKNQSGANIQMVGLKKNGDEFPVEFTMSHWQNGKEKFFCAVMIDMSKHKKLESRLKKTTEDLELFLYRAAHDLKAPLTSVEGLLQLLKDEPLPESAKHLVTMVDETLEKSRMLLDDLALASIISEKSREITSIKFEKKIANALKAIKSMANFENIDFHFDVRQDSVCLFNRELMDFILQTLMRNVIGFMRPKTASHTPKAWISIEVTSQAVKIKVMDNGMGINEKYLPKIFDLYFSIYKTEAHSTGLELYIVKRIIEEFKGEITVESEIDKGTTFEVVLPNLKEGETNYD